MLFSMSHTGHRSIVVEDGSHCRFFGAGCGAVMSMVRLSDLRWQRHLVLRDGWRIFVRPTSPDDEPLIRDLLRHVSKGDLRLRFFDSIEEFSHQFIAKITDLDGLRAIAFVAFDEANNETLGVVWLYSDSIHETGEYAILLRSDLKGRGLALQLRFLFEMCATRLGLVSASPE
jgi:hypothetical protein